jgi:hypothetical protein
MTKLTRLALVAALVALPVAAQAQTGSITASALISTVFNFGTPSPLSFGTVTPGTAATGSGFIALTRNVGVIYTLPDAGNTGKLTSAAGTLTPSYTCGVGTTSSTIVQSFTSCAPASAATAMLTQPTPTTTVTEYVIFSGSLTAAQTNVAAGTYSGTIRITATPN